MDSTPFRRPTLHTSKTQQIRKYVHGYTLLCFEYRLCGLAGGWVLQTRIVSLCISVHVLSCQSSCLHNFLFLLHHQVLHLTSSSLTTPTLYIFLVRPVGPHPCERLHGKCGAPTHLRRIVVSFPFGSRHVREAWLLDVLGMQTHFTSLG